MGEHYYLVNCKHKQRAKGKSYHKGVADFFCRNPDTIGLILPILKHWRMSQRIFPSVSLFYITMTSFSACIPESDHHFERSDYVTWIRTRNLSHVSNMRTHCAKPSDVIKSNLRLDYRQSILWRFEDVYLKFQGVKMDNFF